MKVRVVIEYEIPAIDALTDDDVQMIEQTIAMGAPSAFEADDGCTMLSSDWTVQVQR